MIPTAESIYYETFKGLNIEDSEDLIPKLMIEFAKLHVTEALKKASKKAQIIDTYKTRWNGINKESYIEKSVHPDSIINAYPLTNIK